MKPKTLGTNAPCRAVTRYELSDYLVKAAPHTRGRAGGTWDLGLSGSDAVSRALTGDMTIAAAMIDGLATPQGANEDMPALAAVRDVAGSRVSVPDYLAGSPTCMRRVAPRPKQTRHVGVYVSCYSSAGLDASTLLERGRCIIAYLEELQAQRIAVDLYLVGEAGERATYYEVIHVESRPLDLSVAGFVIAHPAFSRNVMYETMMNVTRCPDRGPWPGSRHPDYHGYYATTEVRANLDMSPEDVWIGGAVADDPMVRNPKAWLKAQLERIA